MRLPALAYRPRIVRMLREAADYSAGEMDLRGDAAAQEVLGPAYQGIATPWSNLGASIGWAQGVRKALPAWADATAVVANGLEHRDLWASYARFLSETLADLDKAVAEPVNENETPRAVFF